MNWHNLDKNKCPACNKDLLPAWNPEKKMFICKCGFKIKEETFKRMTAKITEEKIEANPLTI